MGRITRNELLARRLNALDTIPTDGRKLFYENVQIRCLPVDPDELNATLSSWRRLHGDEITIEFDHYDVPYATLVRNSGRTRYHVYGITVGNLEFAKTIADKASASSKDAERRLQNVLRWAVFFTRRRLNLSDSTHSQLGPNVRAKTRSAIGKTYSVGLRMHQPAYDKLRMGAAMHGVSVSAVIELLLSNWDITSLRDVNPPVAPTPPLQTN